MNHDSGHLAYLTIDSFQWSQGHVRPRMTKEDKRAKHRVHQRHFVLRQRERLEQLRREFRCHELHLLRLQLIKEAAKLRKENDSLRLQLSFALPATQPDTLLDVDPLCPIQQDRLQVSTEESVLLELLTLLPEIKAAGVKFDDSCCSAQSDVQELAPLAWSPTTPRPMSMVEPLV